jgi:hypothetical protein
MQSVISLDSTPKLKRNGSGFHCGILRTLAYVRKAIKSLSFAHLK